MATERQVPVVVPCTCVQWACQCTGEKASGRNGLDALAMMKRAGVKNLHARHDSIDCNGQRLISNAGNPCLPFLSSLAAAVDVTSSGATLHRSTGAGNAEQAGHTSSPTRKDKRLLAESTGSGEQPPRKTMKTAKSKLVFFSGAANENANSSEGNGKNQYYHDVSGGNVLGSKSAVNHTSVADYAPVEVGEYIESRASPSIDENYVDWYPATVTRQNGNGTWQITYAEDGTEVTAAVDQVRKVLVNTPLALSIVHGSGDTVRGPGVGMYIAGGATRYIYVHPGDKRDGSGGEGCVDDDDHAEDRRSMNEVDRHTQYDHQHTGLEPNPASGRTTLTPAVALSPRVPPTIRLSSVGTMNGYHAAPSAGSYPGAYARSSRCAADLNVRRVHNVLAPNAIKRGHCHAANIACERTEDEEYFDKFQRSAVSSLYAHHAHAIKRGHYHAANTACERTEDEENFVNFQRSALASLYAHHAHANDQHTPAHGNAAMYAPMPTPKAVNTPTFDAISSPASPMKKARTLKVSPRSQQQQTELVGDTM